MTRAATLLSDVFGFDSFRPGQQDIVEAVAAGENVLAIMPTGGGKSLCFQLPALLSDGLTVVITPLIALIRDQVQALKASGVAAGALTSGNTDEETADVFAALEAGTLKLLYMAPERLASGAAVSMLRKAGVDRIAVDEAHCVSQWGHDFRPDYLRIGALRESLGVPVAAFTATADTETQGEIVERLFRGTQPSTFLRGFDRPNIHLAFSVKDGPRKQILDFAHARKGQSGIVYCGTRAKTEGLAKALREDGHSACHYHGGMEPDLRRTVERRFQQEDGLIVVATVAFGMGIDKPDIRWVAHADLPKSIESYYQEIGRGGRDGAPAETLTLFGLRTDEYFGAGHLIDILTGTETEKVRARGHDGLPTFGVGTEYSRREWQAVFRQMMGHDLVRPDPERHGALRMTDAALPVLRAEQEISLRRDTIKSAGKSRPKVRTLVSEEDAPLLSALKAKRRALAEAQRVPAYIVFNDKTLIEMAQTRPATLDAMAGIGGIGAKKLETYGAAFLEVINGASEDLHPARRKLAGREDGSLYDLLMAAQADLARGQSGLDKPLSCSASQLAKVAKMRPRDETALEKLLGEKRAERFGAAFLDVLREAG